MGTPASARQPTVADAMIIIPKTHDVEISLADAEPAFADVHVHMLLLTRVGILHGTLVRDDLRSDLDRRRPALAIATLDDRTIRAERSLDEARRSMERLMMRRLAVTDDHDKLLGLLCLKQTRQGFCTEADVLARAGAQLPASAEVVGA
jgi:CBS domain-containing protein